MFYFRDIVSIFMLAVVCILLLLVLSSCTNLATLTETLNERNVTSCLWYSGAAGPYAQVRGVTATGGAVLKDCLKEGR